jgi:hypothetical protein
MHILTRSNHPEISKSCRAGSGGNDHQNASQGGRFIAPSALSAFIDQVEPYRQAERADEERRQRDWCEKHGLSEGLDNFEHETRPTPAADRARFLTGETMKALAVRVNDVLLFACIIALGILAISASATVGFGRVERAEQIVARV